MGQFNTKNTIAPELSFKPAYVLDGSLYWKFFSGTHATSGGVEGKIYWNEETEASGKFKVNLGFNTGTKTITDFRLVHYKDFPPYGLQPDKEILINGTINFSEYDAVNDAYTYLIPDAVYRIWDDPFDPFQPPTEEKPIHDLKIIIWGTIDESFETNWVYVEGHTEQGLLDNFPQAINTKEDVEILNGLMQGNHAYEELHTLSCVKIAKIIDLI